MGVCMSDLSLLARGPIKLLEYPLVCDPLSCLGTSALLCIAHSLQTIDINLGVALKDGCTAQTCSAPSRETNALPIHPSIW